LPEPIAQQLKRYPSIIADSYGARFVVKEDRSFYSQQVQLNENKVKAIAT
jgi:hypothetical protein